MTGVDQTSVYQIEMCMHNWSICPFLCSPWPKFRAIPTATCYTY